MEVAKMDEYISKQAFKEKYLFCGWLPEMSKKEFDGFPAADVVEVRHGRWIVFDPENPESKECTACGYLFSRIHPSNYCPNCGARMDGKEDDHD